jgi:heme-degrading monooxygenase HmoA
LSNLVSGQFLAENQGNDMQSLNSARTTHSNNLSKLLLAAVLGLSLGIPSVSTAANESEAATSAVVIVRVAKPWYAPKAAVVSKMRDTIDQYSNIPGLAFKAFSFERQSGDYGGIYLWKDQSSAQNWFNREWFDRVKRERGSEAFVRTFSAPLAIDNTPGGTPANPDSATVATLVEIPIPASISVDQVVAGFKDAIPTYLGVPGLLRKYFISSDKGTFGGVYLWKDEASANAWFTQAWKDRVAKTYGQPAKIEWFDTPILTPSKDSKNILRPAIFFQAK